MNYPHNEAELAKALGLSHDVLKALRAEHLAEGDDWRLVKGKVCLTDAARGHVEQLLKISVDPAAAAQPPPAPADSAPNTAEKIAPPEAPTPAAREAELICRRLCWPNTRLIEAELPGTPGVQRVQVRTNKNFAPGMKLPCREVRPTLWDFTGRLPRWRGRY